MKDYKYTLSILIAAAIAVVIGLLTSCTMVTNYYIVYPTKMERVETKQPEWPYGGGISLTPGIDPGFYQPINTPYTLELKDYPAPDTLQRLVDFGDDLYQLRFDSSSQSLEWDLTYQPITYTIDSTNCNHTSVSTTELYCVGGWLCNTCTCNDCGKQWKCN